MSIQGTLCKHGELESYVQPSERRDSAEKQCSNGEKAAVSCYEECADLYFGVGTFCINENFITNAAAVPAVSAYMALMSPCYLMLVAYAPLQWADGEFEIPPGLADLDFSGAFLECDGMTEQ